MHCGRLSPADCCRDLSVSSLGACPCTAQSATISSVGDIRVHIDTLEYTRAGLQTKEPINLKVGEHNSIVLVRPKRLVPRSVAYASFRSNSSFPTPGVLLLGLGFALDRVSDQFEQESTRAIYQVYGHTDASGEDEPNKLFY